MEVSKIYSMIYDSKEYGNSGYGDYIGEFIRVKQFMEDGWVDSFLGINTTTNELCIVLSTEITGHGGGIRYEVTPIKDFKSDLISTITLAEWEMVLDDFEDGKGEQEYPHCSMCNRGVYRHDAGSWCPFCGAAMKNPMR